MPYGTFLKTVKRSALTAIPAVTTLETYIHTYTHIHTYIHTYIHTFIIHTHTHTYIHTYINFIYTRIYRVAMNVASSRIQYKKYIHI